MKKLDFLGEILLNWRIKFVFPYLKGKLLDVGCGTNKLVRKYKNGVGVDVYQFGDADLILKDTSKTSFDDNEFDTVTIIASLNHIPNRLDVLKEMNRVLKNEGQIIITMIPPFISRCWHIIRSPWDRDQHERGMQEGEVYGMTNFEVKKILDESGFKIIKSKKFMFFINNLVVAIKK